MFFPEIKSKRGEDISIFLKADNHPWNYIVDCGEASGLTVKECQNTKAIFVSHTHIDHFINFDQILRHQIETKQKVVICGPENIASQVQSKILGYTWNLISEGSVEYEIREIINKEEVRVYHLKPPKWELEEQGLLSTKKLFENEKFSVEYLILDHKIPSISYLFSEVDTIKIHLEGSGFKGGKWVNDLKRAFEENASLVVITIDDKNFYAKDLFHLVYISKGTKLGIILDHAATEENHRKIEEIFCHCDQVFIECFYNNSDKHLAEKNFHSYASMSGRIMKECKVKEAIPVHFSRKYTEAEIEDILKEFDFAFKQ